MAQRRVYGVLVDRETRRVLVNTKDGLLPQKLARYEGLICLFGGGVEPGESDLEALMRELGEELGASAQSLDMTTARMAVKNEQVTVFSVAADLSGDHKSATNINRYRHACEEGEASLRTFDWIANSAESLYVEGFKGYINLAIETELLR